MDRDVVEVVARFGGTIIDIAHVGPTGSYRIGTAPDVDLAVPGLTSFPLVEGSIVRCPVGMRASECAGVTELHLGSLELRLTRTKLAPRALPPPRIERRTPVFVVVSLLVHVAIWFVAATYAPFERLPQPRVTLRLAHLSPPPEPVADPPAPAPRQQASATAAQPSQPTRVMRPRRSQHEPAWLGAAAASAAEVAARVANQVDVEKYMAALDGNLYNPEDDGSGGFGSGRRFDPSQREGFGTVETGAYATMVYDVKLCPDRSCTVEGPVPALFVRTHLLHHIAAINDCYMRYASEPGTIVLELTIMPDGAVRDAHGSGLGETGACAARVASEIYFKALGNDWDPPRETHVRYPVRFNPPRG